MYTVSAWMLGTALYGQSSTLSLNNTNSPYSRYGVGQLNDEGFGASRAMGGIGFALRSNNQINSLNPASYSAVDSLTFLMDAGVGLQMSRFSENGSSKTANNSSFDYIAMQFRLYPGLGIAAGLKPYSSVGYNLGTSGYITDAATGDETAATYNYFGNGGFHQVFVGLGYEPIRNLSVGFNISYLFGSITKTATIVSDAYADGSIRKSGTMDLYDYKLDLGAQYTYILNKEKERDLTFGATYSLGHNFNTSSTSTTGSNTQGVTAGIKQPHVLGLGAAYRDAYWTAGIDYSLQLWDQVYNEPLSEGSGNALSAQQPLNNRHRIAIGAEWVPNLYARNYFKQVRYRFGAHYTTPYYKVKTAGGSWTDGPKEWGVSGGFGLPLRILRNRSLVHLSMQYVRTSLPNLVSDNTFRLCVGITFNETWFKKWRVE